MADEPRLLPLFPLNTVLFPHMQLPLRVFEQRYRQMLDYCLAQDRVFGVVLIREGREVGGAANPYDVGTVAHIDNVEKLPDGTLTVTTTGQRRFRLVELAQNRPYMVGMVTYLDDADGGRDGAPSAPEVRSAAQQALGRMLALNNEWVRDVPLPRSSGRLSFALAEKLPLDLPERQRLLEALTADERLRMELPMLRGELERAEALVAQREWLGSLKLN